MLELRIPEGVEWELIVVNNNCTDHTDAVIRRHAPGLPIRRIFEPRQGLSIARNAAITASRGDLILWTDDDVLVDPDWLAAYVEAAWCWPDAGYFGGEIIPWYEAEPPRWIESNLHRLQGMLVVRQLGEEEKVFEGEEFPYGANMAFRRDVLARNRFNPNIGYVGARKMFGDEIWLLSLLRARGMQGVWVPSAKIRHYIPKSRASVRFLMDYFYWDGRTLAQQEAYPESSMLCDAPRFLYRRYWSSLLHSAMARVTGRPEWVELLIAASRDRGRIHEFREKRSLSHSVAFVGEA